MPEVVPVQVDSPELPSALGRERRPVVRLPFRLHFVGLEHRRDPCRSESTDWLAGLVAEHQGLGRLLLVVSVEW